MDNIYTRLIEARKALGLTQKQVSEGAGVALRTYCRYESGEGERDIPSSLLKFIAQNNININWLLTGEGEMFLPSTSSATVPAEALEEEAVRAMEIVKEDPLTQRTALMMGMMSEAQRRDILARAEEIKQRDDEAREVRELKEQIRELMEKATG